MNERQLACIITEELKKSDVIEIAKKDKDFEKRIKSIVRDVVKDMFRVLWMHNSMFNTLGN